MEDEFGNKIITKKNGLNIKCDDKELGIEDGGFIIKSSKSDLFAMLKELIDTLTSAVVLTYSGPGMFNPTTTTKLQSIKTKLTLLFK
jgi:hypothetical protein